MKQTFVNNIDQLMSANQNQRIKINYLESQKQKREQYLSGLKESIMLNKQTLIVINQEGPNDQAISAAARENLYLIKLNESLYGENRRLNAELLMEQQLRVEDKAFFTERIAEFENRITDLRKYLHDKEETFSAVVSRLKKYEEWNQKPLAERIQDTDGLKKVTNEVLIQVMAERNMLKAKFEQVFPNAQRFNILAQAIKNPVNASRFMHEVNKFGGEYRAFSQSGSPREKLAGLYVSSRKNAFSKQQKPAVSNMKQSQMTKQLMRLLKKQKINNHILETALHSAIQKNEELLKINQNLDAALHNLEKKMEKLIAQNIFYKLKIKEFSYGYGKKYIVDRTKEMGDGPRFQQLLELNFQIKDEDGERVNGSVYKDLLKESFKEDIEKFMKMPLRVGLKAHMKNDCRLGEQEKMTQMTTNDNTRLNEKIVNKKEEQRSLERSGNEVDERRMMVKCASEPRLFIKWEDGELEEEESRDDREEMVVEEF